MTVIYLSPEAVALRIGVKVHTLAKWRVAGDGPKFVRVSPRMIRYIESDLDQWMRERVRHSTADTGDKRHGNAA